MHAVKIADSQRKRRSSGFYLIEVADYLHLLEFVFFWNLVIEVVE